MQTQSLSSKEHNQLYKSKAQTEKCRLTLEFHSEGQSIEVPSIFLLHVILKVHNVFPTPEPRLILQFVALGGMHQHLEPLIVQRIGFHEVQDVEFVLNVPAGVGDGEEVPLGMSPSVVVWVDDQVVFIWGSNKGSGVFKGNVILGC